MSSGIQDAPIYMLQIPDWFSKSEEIILGFTDKKITLLHGDSYYYVSIPVMNYKGFFHTNDVKLLAWVQI